LSSLTISHALRNARVFSIVFVFFQRGNVCYTVLYVTPCGTFFCQEKNTLRASRGIPYNGAPRPHRGIPYGSLRVLIVWLINAQWVLHHAPCYTIASKEKWNKSKISVASRWACGIVRTWRKNNSSKTQNSAREALKGRPNSSIAWLN
jgi:hypothetical protein